MSIHIMRRSTSKEVLLVGWAFVYYPFLTICALVHIAALRIRHRKPVMMLSGPWGSGDALAGNLRRMTEAGKTLSNHQDFVLFHQIPYGAMYSRFDPNHRLTKITIFYRPLCQWFLSGLVMMPTWEQSQGASAERTAALAGRKIIYHLNEDMQVILICPSPK